MTTASESRWRSPIRLDSPVVARAASLLLLILVWEIVATALHDRLLPPPGAVLRALGEETASGRFPHHLAVTLRRVGLSFLVAMTLGSVIGIGMGRWSRLDRLFDSWIILLLNLPALVVIVLAYVWLGLNDAAVVIAVAITKLPATVITVREGARGLDRDYSELVETFRIDRWRSFRHVVLPQLLPFLLVAARSGLSLVWKIVLVAELLGCSDGIGFMIQLYFQLFDVAHILAYTIGFAVIVQLIEWAILQPLERRTGRWRR
jgi:NitT/TauT family transport system permease protein